MLLHVQAVQKEIGKRKRYIDITGNWLNHPNDYLARILAQVVIKGLIILVACAIDMRKYLVRK